ncbi:phosphotransferase [Fulvivirgaceae bacterium BMA12]|uniref:Phosphotransferase n=1 Tax=Agaribacillus aureus TaxID=3051825 RepID=A0ABT8L8I2_9BACT|nr:phosphotransferase [Fulvivirgaceae bacterium BMA12]
MTTFPVTDSTLSASHLASFIRETYGLAEKTTCKVFRTGINHTYMVSGNHLKYVWRVYSYNWRSETEILEELRLLNILKENDIPVSYPIMDKNQNYIQTLHAPEGKRYAVLFSFAEGEKIRDLSKETCQIIGSVMARIHKVTVHKTLDRIKYNPETLTLLPYQYACRHYAEGMEEMQFVKAAGKAITQLFERANVRQIRPGIVHMDMWYDNMNIKNESLVTLFDFDFCGNGWLILDIAYFNLQLFNTTPDKAIYEEKMENFMQGYEAITPITPDEKKILPYAGMASWIFYLGVQAQRFDNWSNIFFTNNYLKHYIGLVKRWMEHHGITIDTLQNEVANQS